LLAEDFENYLTKSFKSSEQNVSIGSDERFEYALSEKDETEIE
jgi:hypothetical protein